MTLGSDDSSRSSRKRVNFASTPRDLAMMALPGVDSRAPFGQFLGPLQPRDRLLREVCPIKPFMDSFESS
jgi:hypothetical protein